MKFRMLAAGLFLVLAGFLIAQATQPEMPKNIEKAKERCDKTIERAEQDYIKAKGRALSRYHRQLDRAIKHERDPEVAKQLSEERARVLEEIQKARTNVINNVSPKGLIGRKLWHAKGRAYHILKPDGTMESYKKNSDQCKRTGKWKPVKAAVIGAWDDGAYELFYMTDENKLESVFDRKGVFFSKD